MHNYASFTIYPMVNLEKICCRTITTSFECLRILQQRTVSLINEANQQNLMYVQKDDT